jgi:hypothetical protein
LSTSTADRRHRESDANAMTTKTLTLLGLSASLWEPRARELLGASHVAAPVAAWHRLADSQPCLAVLERPACALASAFAAEPGLAADAWLAAWRDDATQLLAVVQRRGAHCLVVSADSLWTAPAEVLGACHRRFPGLQGLPAPAVASVAPAPALDPVLLALAEAALAGDRAARALAAELAALATPFGAPAPAVSPVPAARVRVRELAHAASQVGPLRARLQRTEVELEQCFLAEQAARAASKAAGEAADALKASQVARVALATRVDQASKALAAARADKALLEAQVHALREELETYFVAWQELQQSAGTAGADPSLQIGRTVRLGMRNEDPHRECSFELQDVRHGERALGRLRLRLVEHHGHAGLVFLPLAGQMPPLQRWRESGHEGDQAYLLLIPDDVNTHGPMDEFSATDWHLLTAIAARLEALAGQLDLGERWVQVARRFRQQLGALAPRLRFDDVALQVAGAGPALTFEMNFDRASCGETVDGPLRLRWRLQGAERDAAAPGTLSVAASDRTWASWPRTPDGAPADWLALPLGRASATPEGRAAWDALTAVDRVAALGLVRALPAVLARVPAESWPAGQSREALVATAEGVGRETQRRPRASSVRRAARALLGRDLAQS